MVGRELARLSGIEVRYPNLERPAITGTDVTIHEKEILAITGPSGSGKSTLLSVLGLLITPTSGGYRLLGTDVTTASDGTRARLRAEHIGFVFQAYHLLSHLTAIDNVLLGARYSLAEEALGSRAGQLLARFGLQDRCSAFPRELSGGEQQRVAIARALVAAPAIVLCDEPTGNLDRKSAERVMAAILAGRDEADRAIVLVTHDVWVAEHADRVLNLEIPR
ncbi:MAG: putative transport system ATP-binding protein [Thermoleophilaceae bacterium]|jgi:ABC-type lipoprotein export system ATPase subunit|nr:putative transport system ATP-binding protein [Thermoleophilaceae bacterium]